MRTQKKILVEDDERSEASASERGCSSDLMPEAELIRFLRIPEVSNSKNHHYVVENHATRSGTLQAAFGWKIHVGPQSNPGSLSDFPMQADGS